jgi:hypothetical protein
MQADRPGRGRPGTGQLRDLRLGTAASPIIAVTGHVVHVDHNLR